MKFAYLILAFILIMPIASAIQATVKVVDLSGAGIAGKEVVYKAIGGAWSSVSITGADGNVVFTIDPVSSPKYLFRAKCGAFITTNNAIPYSSDEYAYSGVPAAAGQDTSATITCSGQDVSFNTAYNTGGAVPWILLISKWVWDGDNADYDSFRGYTDSQGIMQHWIQPGTNRIERQLLIGGSALETISIPLASTNKVYLYDQLPKNIKFIFKNSAGTLHKGILAAPQVKGATYPMASKYTDANGAATFALSDGYYSLLLYRNGPCNRMFKVDSTTPAQVDVVCELYPITYSFNFVDPATNAIIGPVAGVQHGLQWYDVELSKWVSFSPASGGYFFTGADGKNTGFLTPGRYYSFDLAPYVMMTHSREFTVSGPAEVNVNIPMAGSIVKLKSRYSDGTILPSVVMSLTSTDYTQSVSLNTGAQGEVIANVNPSDFRVSIFCNYDNKIRAISEVFTVPSGVSEKTMYCGNGEMKVITKDSSGNPMQDVKVYSVDQSSECIGCGLRSDGMTAENYKYLVSEYKAKATNVEGYWIFPNIDIRGKYVITGETSKGEKKTATINGCPFPQCTVEITGFLTDKGILKTQVLKRDGTPMSGTLMEYYQNAALIASLNANMSGKAEKILPPGEYVLGARCIDGIKRYKWFGPFMVNVGETTDETITCFKDGIPLTINIIDKSTGKMLDGAYVHIFRKFGENYIQSTETELFVPDTLIYLGAGDYQIRAWYQGKTKNYDINLESGTIAKIEYGDTLLGARGFLDMNYYKLSDIKADDFEISPALIVLSVAMMTLFCVLYRRKKIQ
jgi:hypothetical protein